MPNGSPKQMLQWKYRQALGSLHMAKTIVTMIGDLTGHPSRAMIIRSDIEAMIDTTKDWYKIEKDKL